MVDPASAVAAAKEIDDAVGLIGKLVRKLRAEPDIAAAKLSMALDEVVKTYRVVDEAISMYVSLAIDSDALRAKSQQLASLSGGRLAVHVAEGRGHCHEIDRIRWQHLDRWFERAFGKNTGDYQHLRAVLRQTCSLSKWWSARTFGEGVRPRYAFAQRVVARSSRRRPKCTTRGTMLSRDPL